MTRLGLLVGLCSLPFALPHEATHYALARLGTRDVTMSLRASPGRMVTSWPPLDSQVLRFVASLGPTIVGSVLLAAWAMSGVPATGWRLLGAVLIAMYAIPSPSDIRGAIPRGGGGQ